MIFDPIASSLINSRNNCIFSYLYKIESFAIFFFFFSPECNPEISMEDAAQVIKNMYESDNEEALCNLLSNLDYKRFRFEVLVEQKEFN